MAMLRRDRVPVITIRTGIPGGSLAIGLVTTAKVTDGIYTDSRVFPHQSVIRVRGMLAGTYELFLRTDGMVPEGEHPVAVRVTRRNATAFAPKTVAVRGGDPLAAATVVEVPDSALAAQTSDEAAADLFLRALRALQNGEGDVAESLLTESIATGLAPADAWWERGMLVAARGDLTSAAADLREYLQRMPHGMYARDAREMLRTWQP
jgi:hypothetical protein